MTLPGSNVPLRGAVDLSALRNRPAAASPSEPAAGAPAGGNTARLVIDVTDAMFPEVLELSKTVPVVVDLWAEWCGPCKQIAPALEEISDEMAGELTIAKVNIDDHPMTPGKYGVRGIPTMMIFKDGQVVSTKIGAMAKGKISEWVS